MIEEDVTRIENFESKLSRLMEMHTQLKDENLKLHRIIDQQSVELEEIRQAYSELQQSHTNLKLAKIISIKDQEISDAQERLSRLVRKIDQCIALLNA